ncbi:MAG: MOSC domain-containing protein [Propionibacterium sp.]|nr:MOSC domain-containing protein [Propionibacterium sp.]
MSGRVLAVCVVAQLTSVRGRVGVSGIDKRPVDGPVKVRDLGLFGDLQADRAHHGGEEKAVYVYADESMTRWESELGRELPHGHFGENLRTRGVAVDDAIVGERWRIGTAEFQVSTVRNPCSTFEQWMGEPRWVKRFQQSGLCGAYLRVLRPGAVEAGDDVEVLSRPGHGVTVSQWFVERSAADARALLASAGAGEFVVGERLRAHIESALGRA